MKKLPLLFTLFAFTSFAAFGGVRTKKKFKPKTIKKVVGRECCTKTAAWGENGATITVTACAGWFLSNSDNAKARACEKVDEAIAAYQKH